MILFLLLPLLFIAGEVTVTDLSDKTGNPVFGVDVSTFIPVRRINATVDGRNMPIYEVGANRYAVQPNTNGEMTVTVTLINGQVTTASARVQAVDTATPMILRSESSDDYLLLYVEDTGSGINYEAVYTVTDGDLINQPAEYDPETGCIALMYPNSPMDVYIPDNAGNTLHLLLTVK